MIFKNGPWIVVKWVSCYKSFTCLFIRNSNCIQYKTKILITKFKIYKLNRLQNGIHFSEPTILSWKKLSKNDRLEFSTWENVNNYYLREWCKQTLSLTLKVKGRKTFEMISHVRILRKLQKKIRVVRGRP